MRTIKVHLVVLIGWPWRARALRAGGAARASMKWAWCCRR